MTEVASLIMHRPAFFNATVSMPVFAQALYRICPSLKGTEGLLLAGKIFGPPKSGDNAIKIAIENYSALKQLQDLCDSYGIQYAVEKIIDEKSPLPRTISETKTDTK